MTQVNCYGPMGAGFSDELRRTILRIPSDEPIELHISSPGGMLCEGITAYNLLKNAPNDVHAVMDGDAFSAATLLVCAADHCDMPDNTLMMVHNPWVPGVMPGTIEEVGKTLSYLKATRDQASGIYQEKTGKSARVIRSMMKKETYLDAHQAMGAGFVHNVTGPSALAQNRPLDDYSARDKDRLATMLGKRHICRDIQSILDSIGV